MPQTVQQTLQDPKFYGLPPGEQQKVLATLDPNYARLPLAERTKVLQTGQQKLNAAPAAPSIDLTTNSINPATGTGTGYGLYRMGSYDFNRGQVSKPEILVPYNRVQDALAAGYQLHPDEAPRYQQDTAPSGPWSRISSQIKSLLSRMTEPMPDTPLTGSVLQRADAAAANIEKLPFNVVNRALRGLTGLPQSVAQTATGFYQGDPAALENLDPATTAESTSRGFSEDVTGLGPMAALGNLGGDAATMYAAGKLGGRLGEVGDTAADAAKDAARAVIRRVAGSGPGVAGKLVRAATEDNRVIDLHNADKMATAQQKWRDDQAKAVYDHQAELLRLKQKYAQDTRNALEKARTGTAEDRAQYQSKQLAAKQAYDQSVRDQTEKFQNERVKALQANADAVRAHNQKIGEVAQQNRAATEAERAKTEQAARLQVGGSQLIYGLRQLDKALRDRAATMYDTIREKVGDASLPGADLNAAAKSAMSKIAGTSVTPTVFKDILGKYPDTDPDFIVDPTKGVNNLGKVPKGSPYYEPLKAQLNLKTPPPVTFADLQGYYSELGTELSKGTLPADVYQATRALQDSIGNMMQKMADQAKVGNQFWDARVFYRRYMDAFHEPTGPSSSGSPIAQALLAKDPLVAVDKFANDSGNRGIADLRRYSDSLANLAQDVRKTAQNKVTVPKRESVAPPAAPKPVPAGANLPLPGVVEPEPVPRASNLPLPPVLPEVENVPFKQPKLSPRKVITEGDLQRANEAAVRARANGLAGHLFWWTGVWPAFKMLSEISKGAEVSPRGLMLMPASGAAGLATEELMSQPAVVNFLTKATKQQIASIPPELRGEMPSVVALAKTKGVPVSPILAAYAATIQRNQNGQQANQPTGGPTQ
jgi:hypothetical protein